MKQNTQQYSEKELGKRILHLHNVRGLGYRRIAKELMGEGIRLNKDQVNKLYLKYKKNDADEVKGDRVLEDLKKAEARALNELEVKREKHEIRRRLVELFIKNRTVTFEQWRELFTNQEKLLRFAKRAMPVVDPMLWTNFCLFCKERDFSLAFALARALGSQFDYEEQNANDLNRPKNFGVYLKEAISNYLQGLIRAEERKEEEAEKAKAKLSFDERKTEIITIEVPDDFSWQ
jgi:hypothetical protein